MHMRRKRGTIRCCIPKQEEKGDSWQGAVWGNLEYWITTGGGEFCLGQIAK